MSNDNADESLRKLRALCAEITEERDELRRRLDPSPEGVARRWSAFLDEIKNSAEEIPPTIIIMDPHRQLDDMPNGSVERQSDGDRPDGQELFPKFPPHPNPPGRVETIFGICFLAFVCALGPAAICWLAAML